MDVDTLDFDLIQGRNKWLEAESIDWSELSYAKFLPRFLCFCDRCGIKVTFFIIAKHALNKKNSKIIKTIANNGHEIANHTLNHLKHFAYLNEKQMEEEISTAEDLLTNVTGKPIFGFRAPGYIINEKIISILIQRGYIYDSSVLPSWTYNALKLFFKQFCLKGEDKKYLSIQNVKTCFAPIHPYRIDEKCVWKKDIRSPLLEIPINIIPFIRFPFASSLISSFGFKAVFSFYYFLRRSGQSLHYQFHDNEFVEKNDLKEVGVAENRFYLTRRHLGKKLDARVAHFERLFSYFSSDYSILTMKDMAKKILDN